MIEIMFDVEMSCNGFQIHSKIQIMQVYQANLMSIYLPSKNCIIGKKGKHLNCQRVLQCKEEKVDLFPLFSEELFFLGKRKE